VPYGQGYSQNDSGFTTGIYAAGYMLQSSPGMICPYYDRGSYTGSSNAYSVVCGYYYDGTGLSAIGTTYTGTSCESCSLATNV